MQRKLRKRMLAIFLGQKLRFLTIIQRAQNYAGSEGLRGRKIVKLFWNLRRNMQCRKNYVACDVADFYFCEDECNKPHRVNTITHGHTMRFLVFATSHACNIV